MPWNNNHPKDARTSSMRSIPGTEPTALDEKIALNKAMLDAFNTDPADPKVSECVADHYIQHNLLVPNLKAGYVGAIGAIHQGSKQPGALPFSSKVIRAFGDPSGPYTFFHVEYEFFGPKVGFDICRWEDGKIVEHWDNLAEPVADSVNGNTMTDGPVAATDLDKTELNKRVVHDFTFNVLTCGRLDELDKYVGDELIQHDPKMPNGKAALKETLQKLAGAGATYYQQRKPILVGQGNFVIATGEQHLDPADPTSQMAAHWDMYRLADGKIVEHWNAVEPLLPEDKHAHKNGKW